MSITNFFQKNKKIIALVLMAVFLILLIYYLSGRSKTSKTESALESQTESQTANTSQTSEEIMKDTAYLSALLSLEKISIDTKLFDDKSFQGLVDNTVKIERVEIPGRLNPFIQFYQSLTADSSTTLPLNSNIPIAPKNKNQ